MKVGLQLADFSHTISSVSGGFLRSRSEHRTFGITIRPRGQKLKGTQPDLRGVRGGRSKSPARLLYPGEIRRTPTSQLHMQTVAAACHSIRNATAGSILVARSAGIEHAISATATSSVVTKTKV